VPPARRSAARAPIAVIGIDRAGDEVWRDDAFAGR